MDETLNRISGEIVDAAIRVHSALGPGLLESAYEACLIHELTKRSLLVHSQVAMPVIYDGVQVDVGFRVDLLVEKQVIVELKTVENILPIHRSQLKTYLKLSGLHLGLLINFNTRLLKEGIERIVY